MLQTSRLGIPLTQRSWSRGAQAAFTFARPTWECRRSQAAPSADTPANHPQRNLHGTHQSTSTLGCRRSTQASKPPEKEEKKKKMKKQAERRERRDSSSSSCWSQASNQSSPAVCFCCGTCCLTGCPLCLHLSTLSSLTPLLHKMLERRGGGGGRRAPRWMMRGC